MSFPTYTEVPKIRLLCPQCHKPITVCINESSIQTKYYEDLKEYYKRAAKNYYNKYIELCKKVGIPHD